MTAIIAYSVMGTAVMGCDSQASAGNRKYTLLETEKKVIRYEDVGLLVGLTGYARDGDLLKEFTPPSRYENTNDNEYIVETVRALREHLMESHKRNEPTDSRMVGSEFLILYREKIWMVSCDFSVMQRTLFDAIGSGAEVAIGYLEACIEHNSEPNEVESLSYVRGALTAAAKHCQGVGEPFHVEKQ